MKNVFLFIKLLLFIISLVGIAPHVYSQNLKKIGEEGQKKLKELKEKLDYKKFKIRGGITAFSGFNFISGIDRRRNPFIWRLNGNFTIDYLGVSTSISANLSSSTTIYSLRLPSYKLPSYQFIGLSPTYKWITLHLGTRSMHFSDYTLANHSFTGVGVELKPGNFRFAAMYGRLRRATAEDFNSRQNFDPAYQRMGMGFKMGYEKSKDHISLILFSAYDDENSIAPITTVPGINPTDNVVLGLVGQKYFGKTFFKIDFGRSAHNRNKMATRITGDQQASWGRRIAGLHTHRVSAAYDDAFNIGTGLDLKLGTIEFNYERVGPAYHTSGALFFNNDFQNFTIKTATQLLDKKLSLQADLGFQNNNLTGLKQHTNNRIVAALNASYLPSPRWNLQASYSNFNTTSKLSAISIPFVSVDSVVLSLVSQQGNLSITHITGMEQNSIWTFMTSFYQANNITNDVVEVAQKNSNYQGMLNHTYVFSGSEWIINTSLLTSLGVLPTTDLLTLSPAFSVGKSFFNKKLKFNTGITYLLIYADGSRSNTILTSQLGLNYQVTKKQSLGFQGHLANRRAIGTPSNTNPGFTETNLRINYSWRF